MGFLFCVFTTNEAKEDDSKSAQYKCFLKCLLFCFICCTWMKNYMKDFHLCEEESHNSSSIHLWWLGRRHILGDHPFYSGSCLWLSALVPDFLTNRHLAFSLSLTYSSLRTSCKQVGEFHSLGTWEYIWSFSHFKVDFSPIIFIYFIARCLWKEVWIRRPGRKSQNTCG